ncbi:hypothetical protein ACHAQA_008743 [Verticillium albo-atrum]
MSSQGKIYFGPFEVTEQASHVLICPLLPHKRLTDLSTPEVTDLFTTTQRVQKMLAQHYFPSDSSEASSSPSASAPPEAGSFNIALQDGAGAGQTVPHVHVHILPRIPGATSKSPGPKDEIYEQMTSEEGNVGGALWDAVVKEKGVRPQPGGAFPHIDDSSRKARSMEEMVAEAEVYKKALQEMGQD